jgi:hypothetical protein
MAARPALDELHLSLGKGTRHYRLLYEHEPVTERASIRAKGFGLSFQRSIVLVKMPSLRTSASTLSDRCFPSQ